MKQVVVIGGGIIGLSTAFYLQQAGCRVTVLDKGDFLDNCSYGNAGYVCPSHFIPLATPGIVRQGIRWMLNDKSPFYVQPRLNAALIDWGWKFMRSATRKKVEDAAIPLRDIALLSQGEYRRWSTMEGFQFAYEHKGLLEIFQTTEKELHARQGVDKACELGLEARMLDYDQLKGMEPQTRINGLGAAYYPCDAHLYPNNLMKSLIAHLTQAGVRLLSNCKVDGFEKSSGKLTKIKAEDKSFDADECIIASGAWSRELVGELGLKLPLVPGRGYSVTLTHSPYRINCPAVLMEGRVAITPMDGNKIRFGGTMEITATDTPPRFSRVKGILDAVKSFYPDFEVPMPSTDKIWYGYRPCSADGLPYIGRIKKFSNVIVATGHAMVGLSLGAGTGKLVSELVCEKALSMDIKPFAVERFS